MPRPRAESPQRRSAPLLVRDSELAVSLPEGCQHSGGRRCGICASSKGKFSRARRNIPQLGISAAPDHYDRIVSSLSLISMGLASHEPVRSARDAARREGQTRRVRILTMCSRSIRGMTSVPIVGPFLRLAVGALALSVLPMADLAAAQELPRPAAEFAAGWVGFADDGIVSEGLVGGVARWYVLPRIGVGPEVVYILGDNHSHLIVTGNVTFDLFAPTSGRPRPITPVLVVGGGVFQTRESFSTETFTSSEGTFTAGGGVRALVTDRVTVGVDMRVGWELHLRVNGSLGLRLGRR
jgi:hypothetical protein